MASARHPSNYLPSVVGNDVRHQISVAPADQTGIHISDLEEVVHGGITGSTAVSTNFLSLFAGQIIVLGDHCHAWSYVPEDRTL